MPATDVLGRHINAGSYVIYESGFNGRLGGGRSRYLGLVREITLEQDAKGNRTYFVRMNTLDLHWATYADQPDGWPQESDCKERTTRSPSRLCIINFVPEKFGAALGDYHAT
jgi:hypothetical protein